MGQRRVPYCLFRYRSSFSRSDSRRSTADGYPRGGSAVSRKNQPPRRSEFFFVFSPYRFEFPALRAPPRRSSEYNAETALRLIIETREQRNPADFSTRQGNREDAIVDSFSVIYTIGKRLFRYVKKKIICCMRIQQINVYSIRITVYLVQMNTYLRQVNIYLS